jgi:ADP-ribose pyrophosphatase YjhB (NUDIX family)
LLLVRHTYGARKWALPGGAVEPTETLSEAVRREVGEEVGLSVRVKGLFGVRHRSPCQAGDGNDAYFVFVVEADDLVRRVTWC